jgi:3-deoxy-D-manno-octulosonic acid kinase
MSDEVLPGYVRVARDGTVLVLRSGLEEALLSAGIAHPDELVARAPATEFKGRGALSLLDLGSLRAVVRPYRRGGFLGRVVRRLSLDPARARAELALHAKAAERGAPVVEALAAVTWRSGLGFHHALATRAVEGARDLEAVLKTERGRRRRACLRAAGEAVRRLHDAGFDHADLNVKNILVQETPGEAPEGFVVDLDRGRIVDPLAAFARRRNLVRLLRSFWKLNLREGTAAASSRDPFRFARAYAMGDRARRRELVRWGRDALPWIRARAVFWRILGLVRT